MERIFAPRGRLFSVEIRNFGKISHPLRGRVHFHAIPTSSANFLRHNLRSLTERKINHGTASWSLNNRYVTARKPSRRFALFGLG
jgi:hypothetical protein